MEERPDASRRGRSRELRKMIGRDRRRRVRRSSAASNHSGTKKLGLACPVGFCGATGWGFWRMNP
jgi:hypothetical protein